MTTHIAGLDVTLEGRYMRQRCAWCDEIIMDYDLAMVAVQIPDDGSEPKGPGAWEVGALVRRGEGVSYVLEDKRLPDDSCAWATLAKPEDFDSATSNSATSGANPSSEPDRIGPQSP